MSNQIETSFQVQLDNRDRATAFARLILVFPVFLFLSSFSIETFFNENMLQTYGLVILPVVLALLFRGVYPSYVLSFNKAVFGLVNRIWAYVALLTDEYPSIIAAVILAVFITLVLRRVTRIGKTLLIMDTFGLAIATISGTQLAFEQNIDWYSAILLGVITAVTGGLLRDVLCQLEPVLLHRETIGTSSLMGAITFVVLTELSVANTIGAIAGGSVVVLTRVLSIRFDLHLPKFKGAK